MKKHILAALFLSISFAASAQLLYRQEKLYKDQQFFGMASFQDSLDNKDVKYIMLSIVTQSKSDKTYFGIADFGSNQIWILADTTGKQTKIFSSPIEVFNYLDRQGWEYVEAIEDTRSTALWAQIFFDITTVKTRMAYIFKRKS